jgi:hypothetical protein
VASGSAPLAFANPTWRSIGSWAALRSISVGWWMLTYRNQPRLRQHRRGRGAPRTGRGITRPWKRWRRSGWGYSIRSRTGFRSFSRFSSRKWVQLHSKSLSQKAWSTITVRRPDRC